MDQIQTVEMMEEEDCWISPPSAQNKLIAVTVVIPTFRAEATLPRALSSALEQTLEDIEIIVVDDASTDSSWDVITRLLRTEDRLRVIRNKTNRGKPVGMNRAIALARGRWLAVLDADDWYNDDRLRDLIAIGEKWRVDMVSDNQFFYDAAADMIVGTAWPPGLGEWELTFDGFIAASNAYFTFNLGMLKPIIRMDFIREHSLGYEPRARHGQDFFHLLQFFLSGGTAAISDRPYYYYTQPFGIVSRRWSHASRTRYDFQTAYEINQQYLASTRETLDDEQFSRLMSRNRRLKTLEYFFQFREYLINKNLKGALERLIRHPALLGFAFFRLRGKLLKRSMTCEVERVVAKIRRAPRHRIKPIVARPE